MVMEGDELHFVKWCTYYTIIKTVRLPSYRLTKNGVKLPCSKALGSSRRPTPNSQVTCILVDLLLHQ